MLRAPRRKVVRVPLQDAELGRRFLHVSHDAAYDPNSCFHIELRWVACAGYMVKDFVQTMYRRARQAGLTLVQLPLKLLDDPFAAPTYVRIAGADALPPAAVAVLQQELLVSNDFLPVLRIAAVCRASALGRVVGVGAALRSREWSRVCDSDQVSDFSGG
jgi:hypothetical protein